MKLKYAEAVAKIEAGERVHDSQLHASARRKIVRLPYVKREIHRSGYVYRTLDAIDAQWRGAHLNLKAGVK